ncbi:MAG: PTS sugar transporter subunit IIA [Planctomycetota bacterium]|nr:PTS sugar transporter subunit IIA [Planctomycetota bacterium]
MPLDLLHAAKILGVSSDTVRRWARQGRLGSRRQGGEYRFEEVELREWAASRGMKTKGPHPSAWPTDSINQDQPLVSAFSRGGVVTLTDARSQEEVFEQWLGKIDMEGEGDSSLLLEDLCAREKLSSTGLGNGIAIPHPRTPNPQYSTKPTIFLAQVSPEVPWNSLDGIGVHSLFLLLNPTPKEHLRILSRVAFILRDAHFQRLLTSKASHKELMEALASLDPTAT